MKRRGFLKMLGIGAAVPAVALPAKAEQDVYEEPHTPTAEYIRSQGDLSPRFWGGPATKIEGPDGSYIYGAADPADWYDAQGNMKRVPFPFDRPIFNHIECAQCGCLTLYAAELGPLRQCGNCKAGLSLINGEAKYS